MCSDHVYPGSNPGGGKRAAMGPLGGGKDSSTKNINLLNEDMNVSRPLATTPENNCTGVGPGSSERYILVIRIE
ncbi:unnamed protein product [Albugo candida]|uniref:Uncharacterized protein n=1 Tax=Albugo candida TaxID=65357 RepID=A0A024FX68_9STRA|nr:unnamed protein product [Albugo candida]|eukprot:CCI11720.1 unnamed protein product [Albugo candida]